jgi:hypothetical protein
MITVTFNITTSSGSYNSSTDGGVTGQLREQQPCLLYGVKWVDGDLEDGVDAVLSAVNTPSGVDTTLLTLTNADNDLWYYPRHNAHTNAGAAIVDGTDLTGERVMPIVDGQLKLAVSNGGNAKTGKCIVYLKEC